MNKIKLSKKKRPDYGWIYASGYPVIDDALEDVRGLLIYQESVMRLFGAVCGLTMGETDNVRRGIGKKKRDVLEAEEVRFMQEGAAREIDEQTLRRYWEMILANAAYSFNESHAVAYSVISAQCLYMLHKYPAIYYTAYLNSHPEEKEKVLGLCIQAGFQIKPPHVNRSANKYSTDGTNIYLPLSFVKGIGSVAADLVEQNKPYSSLADFVNKNGSKVNATMRSLLYIMGAFEGIHGKHADLKTKFAIEKVAGKVYLREYYKTKKNEDGSPCIKTEVFIGDRIDIFDNYFDGTIIPNKRLSEKVRELYKKGFKFGRIKELELGQTSGQGGKAPRKRLEIFTTGKYPEIYIGEWQFAGFLRQLGRDLEVGDYIAYKQNPNYGGRYADEIIILTEDI